MPSPIEGLIADYRSGRRSPVEVVRSYLDRIAAIDPVIHAYTSVLQDEALEQAREAEALIRTGDDLPPLLGVPVSIKDTLHVRGAVSTLGSQMHAAAVSKTDSGVVSRLRGAGAVFLGKTVTAEFAQSAGVSTRIGPTTRNPWDTTRITGGSSGGAAASVAADLAMVAVGTDGGGSVRMPAAFTGLVGLKPSRGLCPDEFGFRGMSDFSSPGPLARCVADAARVFEVIAEESIVPDTSRPLRVAFCPELDGRPADQEVLARVTSAAELLAERGHVVERVDVPVDGWQEIFGVLVLEEEHRERGHLLARHADELTDYVRASLERAAALTTDDVTLARRRRRQFRHRFESFLGDGGFDVVMTPSVAVPAFEIGDVIREVAGQNVDRLWGAYPFTAPFNVADACAASLPCGLASGLPVGVQLVAPWGADARLLDACAELEIVLSGVHPGLPVWN